MDTESPEAMNRERQFCSAFGLVKCCEMIAQDLRKSKIKTGWGVHDIIHPRTVLASICFVRRKQKRIGGDIRKTNFGYDPHESPE